VGLFLLKLGSPCYFPRRKSKVLAYPATVMTIKR
jgi:hypothetical protein